MRQFRNVAGLLLVTLTLTACGGAASKSPPVKELPTIPATGGELAKPGQAPTSTQATPTSQTPTSSPSAPSTTPNPSTQAPSGPTTSAYDQAANLLKKGDANGAIAILVKAVATQPTAENFNLLCYAYLEAERYQEAYDAGNKALHIDPNHPSALYNTGSAALQLGELNAAQGYLQQAIALAPDKYEPHIQLAIAYGMSGRYVLAKYEVDLAERLSPGQAMTQSIKAKVSDMLDAYPPEHLATEGIATLADGTTTLSLHADSNKLVTVYANTGKRMSAVPLGPVLFQPGDAFYAVTLPGGVRGYLLSGPPTSAFISQAREWRLFAMVDGKLRQFIFVDPQKQEHNQRPASDFARSFGPLEVQGSDLVAAHRDDLTGKVSMTFTYKLDMKALTATLVSKE